jgi:hypothetical protein
VIPIRRLDRLSFIPNVETPEAKEHQRDSKHLTGSAILS